MRKIIIVLIGLFIFMPGVQANSINSVDMDIYINEDGSANVTEVWTAYLTEGTEGYKSFSDLGDAYISDFTVKDDSGVTYTSLASWNTSASFSTKAYKSGYNYTSRGVELCWGISEYGTRVYTLTYKINNFVFNLEDGEGVYFNLFNLDMDASNITITISSSYNFNVSNTKIWGFGYTGDVIFSGGNITLSASSLSSSEYIVLLAGFTESPFNASTSIDMTIDELYEEASKAVSTGKILSLFISIFVLLFSLLVNPITWIIVVAIIIVLNRNKIYTPSYTSRNTYLDFGAEGKSLPNDIPYYRDIPCNKDLVYVYFVAYHYSLVPFETLKTGIMGAMLLKWLKEGKINITKTKAGLFSFKDNNYAVDFTNMAYASNEIENNLLNMFLSASGSNKILEVKEFEKWCTNNYGRVDAWFMETLNKEQGYLENQGLITSSSEEQKGRLKRKIVGSSIRQEAINVKGFMNFLLDFSRMPEREYYEVHLWEEYLIFAEVLGIADKVEEQFSKLYPEFKDVSVFKSDFRLAVHTVSDAGYKSSLRRYERASSSRSSSGGGGSSFSSGGSSAGGSSGGGFR